MQIPASYFDDEVREGFFVPSMMKRCWAAQMEVLSDIDVICQKYHISYVADSGTMIGAVRHGGFIPWDDDLDIIMYREDYETFLAHADELPSNYAVLNWRNEDVWSDAFSRVVNSKGIRFDEAFLNAYHGFPYSAGVDVFVLDYLYRDEAKEEERRERAKYLQEAATAISHEATFTEEAEHLLKSLEQQFSFRVDRTKNITRQMYRKVEEYLTEVPYEEADRTCFMSAWMKYHSTAIYKDAYRDTMPVPFEIREIFVPVAYDEVLKNRYGDYMRVYKNGGLHEYPYYSRKKFFWIASAGKAGIIHGCRRN